MRIFVCKKAIEKIGGNLKNENIGIHTSVIRCKAVDQKSLLLFALKRKMKIFYKTHLKVRGTIVVTGMYIKIKNMLNDIKNILIYLHINYLALGEMSNEKRSKKSSL